MRNRTNMVVGLFLGIFVLYLIVELIHLPNEAEEKEISRTQILETKMEEITAEEIFVPQNHNLCGVSVYHDHHNSFLLNLSCNTSFSRELETSVQMLKLYKHLKFENADGGVWKQGWNIEYSPDQWKRDCKLEVFVVPHSHNNAGWNDTFENHYKSQTRNIFTNMVKQLSGDRRKKFIWAEVSFLSLFWNETSYFVKEAFKKLLRNGQLEIVTGGWVMNDEANTNYFGILQQLIEGHQWVKKHLNYTPVNGWAIDPFGHSPTMPYILKRMGFQNLVVQRVHYSVKKYLARSRNLEFHWRQTWDASKSTDLFTQVMPFYSYDVPHTCGPDPKICCQFDFRQLAKLGGYCPWRILPQEITKRNVKVRAEMLLDQYRKKAQLFRTNVLLVPLGDDFRFSSEKEWNYQFSNYQKLFDYMNANPLLFVKAQFGTLKDYFTALHKSHPPHTFGVLSGDFFTYADRDDRFWSGYFTSRPFYKRLDRVLINYLRSAEILYGLASGGYGTKAVAKRFSDADVTLIKNARRSLSLFQHHDAISGTARDHVVEDYANKMHDAIIGLQHVIQQSAYFLLSHPKRSILPKHDTVYFDVDEIRPRPFSLPMKFALPLSTETKRVVIFNSLTWRRKEVVTLCVDFPYVRVTNRDGRNVWSQTSPVFLETGGVNLMYYVSFVADIEALSLVTYYISSVNKYNEYNALSVIKLLNFVGYFPTCTGFENIETVEDGTEFSISNGILAVHFGKDGFIEALYVQGKLFPINIDFAIYRPRNSVEARGAYLFLPIGPAVSISNNDSAVVRVIEGPIYSEVNVAFLNVQHTVKLYKSIGADSLGLEISNRVDISSELDYELVMRITSTLKNGEEFFTDLNGLQMIRRKYFHKLHIQGNFFPMSTAAYIEDEYNRLTIVSGQPVGFGSLKEGQMEVMLDRRLKSNDHQLRSQSVLDNIPIISVFRLLLERRETDCNSVHEKHPSGILSRNANLASLSLLHPLMSMYPRNEIPYIKNKFTPVREELGHDLHLVKLHNMWKVGTGIILHRTSIDACIQASIVEYRSSNGEVNISSIFPRHFGNSVVPTSLSFLHWGTTTPKNHVHQICSMEMKAYLLTNGLTN